MKLKLKLLGLISAIMLTPLASANVKLIGFEMNGLSAYGPSPMTPTNINEFLETGSVGLTRGSGVTTTGTAAGNAWGGNGFDEANLGAAVAAGNFVTLSLVADAGYTFSLNQIDPFNIRRSGTGPTTGLFQYSLNGVDYVNIGSEITWGGTTTGTGNSQSAIDLSSFGALQNISSVTIRIVAWGASAAGGTWYLNNFQAGDHGCPVMSS